MFTPRMAVSFVAIVTAFACGASNEADAVRGELAPGGTLRAGVIIGNPVLAMQDGTDADPRGVAIDLAREIGRRLDVPVDVVPFEGAAAITDAAPTGEWDIVFLAADPAREEVITFSAPYLELEATYLVPAGSDLRTVEAVDAPGIRIAARPRSAYDLFLRRSLSNATLVYPEGTTTDAGLLALGDADVLAGLRDVLLVDASRPELTGSRVLEGHFALMQQAVGVPRGRERAAAWLGAQVEELKASGFVARAIDATGARGARVAPAADPRTSAPS